MGGRGWVRACAYCVMVLIIVFFLPNRKRAREREKVGGGREREIARDREVERKSERGSMSGFQNE